MDSLLFEGRVGGVQYDEKKVKGAIDKVIAELKGMRAKGFDQLAQQYIQIEEDIDRLSKEKKEINEQLKGKIEGLFESSEEVYTRVVETTNVALTLSKVSPGGTKTQTNWKELSNALLKVLEKLEVETEHLVEEFTQVKKVKASTPSLRVRAKEGLNEESVMDALSYYANKVKNEVSRRMSKVDDVLEIIQSKLAQSA